MTKQTGRGRPARLTEVRVVVDGKGRIKSVQTNRKGGGTRENIEEARHFVETLDANRQISRQAGRLPPGATHKMEKTGKGTRRLTRKRFSAR